LQSFLEYPCIRASWNFGMTLTATQIVTNDFNDILFDSTSANNQTLIAQYATQLAGGLISQAALPQIVAALPEAGIVDYVYSLYSPILNFTLSNDPASGRGYWVQQAEKFLTPSQIAAGQLSNDAIIFLDQSFINAAGTGGTPALQTSSGAPTVGSANLLVDQL